MPVYNDVRIVDITPDVIVDTSLNEYDCDVDTEIREAKETKRTFEDIQIYRNTVNIDILEMFMTIIYQV